MQLLIAIMIRCDKALYAIWFIDSDLEKEAETKKCAKAVSMTKHSIFSHLTEVFFTEERKARNAA